MILKRTEFITRVNIDEHTLETWLSEQWLVPVHQDSDEGFTPADVARAKLILELMRDLGVNEPGVGVALHLLDQLHSARGGLASLKRRG